MADGYWRERNLHFLSFFLQNLPLFSLNGGFGECKEWLSVEKTNQIGNFGEKTSYGFESYKEKKFKLMEEKESLKRLAKKLVNLGCFS
jgi:hypothetical protein